VDALLEEDRTVPVMQFYKLYVEEGEEPYTDVFLLLTRRARCGPGPPSL
jgi:hypothetical protein